jgi:hypothetical protein
MELHPTGFPTCTRLALETDGCPPDSLIGTGTAMADARPVVATPVSSRLAAAISPNGTVLLRIRPDLGQMQVIEATPATTPTGTLLAFSVPPAPVPGGPNAATTQLTLDLGKTTTTSAGQEVSYLVNPPDCPPSGWLYRFDFSYENGEQLSVTDTVNCGAPPPLPAPFPIKSAAGGGGDKVAPFETLSFAPLQRVAKLFVTARASEAGTIGASASVSVGGSSKVYRFKKVSRKAVANKAVKLRLKLARTSLRKVKRALSRHKRLKANVTVTARDAAGNARSQKATIRLRA